MPAWSKACLLLALGAVVALLASCQAPAGGLPGVTSVEQLPDVALAAARLVPGGPAPAGSLQLTIAADLPARGFALAFVEVLDWESADATLSNSDPAIAPVTRGASATLNPSLRRSATLSFSPLKAAANYTLVVNLRRHTPAGVLAVIATGTAANFTIAPGGNTMAVPLAPSAGGQLQVNPPVPVVNTPSAGLAGAITTIAGTGSFTDADGPRATAGISTPTGLAYGASGTILISEYIGNRVRILNPALGPASSGYVTTLAGTGSATDSDGPLASAGLNGPVEAARDASGTVYVTELLGSCIRKIATGLPTTNPSYVTTFLSDGGGSSVDGNQFAARVNQPIGLRFDPAGSKLYFSERAGNLIRRIDFGLPPTNPGFVSTVAGTGSSGATDGPAATASFNQPAGLEFDPQGNLYVAELGGNRVRKIALGLAPTSPGFVSTFAGSGAASSVDGPAASASFNGPTGLAFDGQGRFYVTGYYGARIRVIDTRLAPTNLGFVSTLAGSTAGYADGLGPLAHFDHPEGLLYDPSGQQLYISDSYNNRIRLAR